MSRGLVVIAVSMSLLVVMAGLSVAQEAKPWEQPGTKAGEEIVGPDGGKMVWVPAGEFMMGSAEGEGHGDEHPQHRVRISRGFWLGRCTVTLGQWKAYCKKVGIEVGEASAPGDDHPVVNVNWEEAKAYCRTYGLALPTEAQWEYAARGPEGRKYPWGNAWDEDKCCNAGNKGPGGRTWPVGSFPDGVSWCGALDMAGNMFQWCKDWYDEKYYAALPDMDPPGPDTGERRVVRGGSWCNDAGGCRSAHRDCFGPTYRDFGFRGSRTP